MKRRLICMVLLLVLAVSWLCAAHVLVLRSGEDVTLTEETVEGDLSAAQGLKLELDSRYHPSLSWNTTMTVGQKPETRMEFQLALSDTLEEQENPEVEFESKYLDFAYSSNYGLSLEDRDLLPVKKLLEDVASRTPDGESHSETVNFRDYYEYLPVQFNLAMEGHVIQDSTIENEPERDFKQDMEDSFRFPVPEHYPIYVTIQKDGGGKVIDVNLSTTGDSEMEHSAPVREFNMETGNASNGTYLYFFVVARDDKGALWDYSHTPGYSIYRLPVLDGANKERMLTKDDLESVFQLNPKEKIISFQMDASGQKLLMVTEGADGNVLHVLDAETAQEVQTILLNTEKWEQLPRLYTYEDFMVYLFQSGELVVLSRNEDGLYQKAYTAQLPDRQRTWFNKDIMPTVFAFDGQRLAAAHGVGTEQSDVGTSVGLLIYGPEGLRYSGTLRNSLDLGNGAGGLDEPCILHDLAIHWT